MWGIESFTGCVHQAGIEARIKDICATRVATDTHA